MLLCVLCVCLPVLLESRTYYLSANGRPFSYGEFGAYGHSVKTAKDSFDISDLDDPKKVFDVFDSIEKEFPSIQADRIFGILTDFHDEYKNGQRFSTYKDTYFTHTKVKGDSLISISIMSMEFRRWGSHVNYEFIGIDKTTVSCFRRYYTKKCKWYGSCKTRTYQHAQNCDIKETENVFKSLVQEND
mmetsp:Transcript_28629/g.35089  ORF Transcript_28629/g.35089 Transcript_28629/m.35089 type:complete len:187 (+) Transcript_28629:64-624(+)